MKKLIKHLVLAALISVPIVNEVKADNLDITYYAVSEHFSDIPYNQYDHQFIGVTYKGVSLATFKNSFFKRSVLVSYSHYWSLSDNAEASVSLGVMTGYSGRDECVRHKTSGYFCPLLEAGVKYTKYKYVQPKLSFFSGALVLSLSARF